MRKLNNISIKELLSIEDGFYKLETPVAYATVTGKGESTTGEISGVINISTDTKILDGVTKVITSLADDTSYYVDNIWQDGDALEVSAMDEGAEGGGGDQTMYHVVVNSVPITGQYIGAEAAYNDDSDYTALPIADSGCPKQYVEKALDNGLNDAHFDFLLYADDAEPAMYTNELGGVTPTVTGNIEFVIDEGWHFRVSGDGTITFTAQ